MQAAFYLFTGLTWVMIALITGRGHHLTRDQLLSWEVAVSGGLGSATTDSYVGMLTSLMTALAWCAQSPASHATGRSILRRVALNCRCCIVVVDGQWHAAGSGRWACATVLGLRGDGLHSPPLRVHVLHALPLWARRLGVVEPPGTLSGALGAPHTHTAACSDPCPHPQAQATSP